MVRSALAAGIPREDLDRFGDILRRRPPRTGEAPAVSRGAAPPHRLAGRGEEDAADAAEVSAEAPLAQVLSRITDLLEASHGRRGPGDPLERVLEGLGSSGSEGWGQTLSVRKGAAARLALVRALRETPSHFFEYFDKQALAALDEHGATPHEVDISGSRGHARRYLERRSSVSGHRPTVQWLWSIAGAYDALVRGSAAEARARLALVMIAGEQQSMDGGSWLMARELLFEEEPPFSSFGQRSAEGRERPHPVTCDLRWAETALSRFRDLDDWRERRRRLERDGEAAGGRAAAGAWADQSDPSAAATQNAASRRAAARAKALAAKAAAAPPAGQVPPGQGKGGGKAERA